MPIDRTSIEASGTPNKCVNCGDPVLPADRFGWCDACLDAAYRKAEADTRPDGMAHGGLVVPPDIVAYIGSLCLPFGYPQGAGQPFPPATQCRDCSEPLWTVLLRVTDIGGACNEVPRYHVWLGDKNAIARFKPIDLPMWPDAAQVFDTFEAAARELYHGHNGVRVLIAATGRAYECWFSGTAVDPEPAAMAAIRIRASDTVSEEFDKLPAEIVGARTDHLDPLTGDYGYAKPAGIPATAQAILDLARKPDDPRSVAIARANAASDARQSSPLIGSYQRSGIRSHD